MVIVADITLFRDLFGSDLLTIKLNALFSILVW